MLLATFLITTVDAIRFLMMKSPRLLTMRPKTHIPMYGIPESRAFWYDGIKTNNFDEIKFELL